MAGTVILDYLGIVGCKWTCPMLMRFHWWLRWWPILLFLTIAESKWTRRYLNVSLLVDWWLILVFLTIPVCKWAHPYPAALYYIHDWYCCYSWLLQIVSEDTYISMILYYTDNWFYCPWLTKIVSEPTQFSISLWLILLLFLTPLVGKHILYLNGCDGTGNVWNYLTTQPLGSILEAKPLHQGQKTRILGRGSQSCSHLYSTLPVPSQWVYCING